MRILFSALLLLLATATAFGAVCKEEDLETQVSGRSECLVMRRYGTINPTTMVVWLHGNITSGGPANYHFPIAQKLATDLASNNVMSVALVRPGYPDGAGAFSTGYDNGRADNWTRTTIAEVGEAIERLRHTYKPMTVILVGHSGGAALAAVLLGMKLTLAEAAVLVSCPCDLIAWRLGRGGPPWNSEDPMQWVDKVPATTRIIVLTGTKDSTTSSSLAERYVKKLQGHGNDAVFIALPGVEHRNALRNAAVSEAILKLLPKLKK